MAQLVERFRTIARGGANATNRVTVAYLGDRKLRIAIARVDNQLYAFDDLCTCGPQQCPLSSGLLAGVTIMCQCHGSRFDITSGAVIGGPATRPLATYDVRELDGEIQLRA